MPFYKEETFFTANNDIRFDEARNKGDRAFYSGIYRCTVCGNEDIFRNGEYLPLCGGNHDDDFSWKLDCSPKRFGRL